jgi:hypothetical protein
MRKTVSSALGLLLLLTGCEDGTPERNVASVKPANTYSDQLAAMTPLYRNLGLWRAIRDAPQRCKRVDSGAYQQDYRNMAMWSAHCTDTGQWAIFIGANGDVQVRPCADATAIGVPACRPLPPPVPEPVKAGAAAPAKGGAK